MQCITIPLVDIRTVEYMCLYIQYIYFQCNKNVQDAPSIVLGTVDYNRTG